MIQNVHIIYFPYHGFDRLVDKFIDRLKHSMRHLTELLADPFIH